MQVEKQVCNLELAKRLKELGVKQESYLWWIDSDDKAHRYRLDTRRISVDVHNLIVEGISAFTVAELGEMLPLDFWIEEKRYFLGIDVSGEGTKGWTIGYYHDGRTPAGFNDAFPNTKMSGTEADARAKMLIYLLENKLITI